MVCVNTYSQVLFSLKREGNLNTSHHMDGPARCMLSEIGQGQRVKGDAIPLMRGSESSQIHRDGKCNGGDPGLEGEEGRGLPFNGDRVPVWEGALETDGGDDCIQCELQKG